VVLVSLDREKPVQVHRTDYLNGGTALHFAALRHASVLCLQIMFQAYRISAALMNHKSSEEDSAAEFDHEYVG
jgi:E3 ubiquitin-protein ligase XBAT32/33